MSAYDASFDIFEDLEALISCSHRLLVPRQVVTELERLSRRRGRTGAAARLALQLSARLVVVETSGDDADEAILNLCEEYGKCVVCTNDAELKNILKSRGVPVVGVREYSYLDFS